MSADIIAWLRSPEGEEWSRNRPRTPPTTPLHLWQHSPGDPGEDPTGRPPVKGPALIAAGDETA